MHITSSYYRSRQHKDVLELGVSAGLARMVEAAALETEPNRYALPGGSEPLRPSARTLRLLASRYKTLSKDLVA